MATLVLPLSFFILGPHFAAAKCSDGLILGAVILPVYESGEMIAWKLEHVCPESPFALAGLGPGDRILQVGSFPLHGPDESAEALRLLTSNTPVLVRVELRNGSTKNVPWPPELRAQPSRGDALAA